MGSSRVRCAGVFFAARYSHVTGALAAALDIVSSSEECWIWPLWAYSSNCGVLFSSSSLLILERCCFVLK